MSFKNNKTSCQYAYLFDSQWFMVFIGLILDKEKNPIKTINSLH